MHIIGKLDQSDLQNEEQLDSNLSIKAIVCVIVSNDNTSLRIS